jgi:arginyl-tRNA synthetase
MFFFLLGDEEALSIWRTYRELSIKKYMQEYETLNVSFDLYWGESRVGKEWQEKAITVGEEMNIVETSEGAKLVNLEKYKLGKAILRKRGIFSFFLFSPHSLIIYWFRWYFNLFDSRYRWRY